MLQLTAADIVQLSSPGNLRHVVSLKVVFGVHHAVFRSVAVLELVRQGWRLIFRDFALNIDCNVLIG